MLTNKIKKFRSKDVAGINNNNNNEKFVPGLN